jgi:hypothetical protein
MKLYYRYSLLGICLLLTLNNSAQDTLIELDALEQTLVQDIPETLLQDLAAKINQLTILLEQTPAEHSFDEKTLTLMAAIITTILATQTHVQSNEPSSSLIITEKDVLKKKFPMLEQEPESTKQLVIKTLSTIAGNVAAIAAAPRNPQIVGTNLANIFMGIINLMRQVLAKSKALEIKESVSEIAETGQAALLAPQHELLASDTH